MYNVHRGDKDGFLAAIKGAIENPLEGRWISDHMKEEKMRERVRGLVEGDWRGRAEEKLKEMPGVSTVFWAGDQQFPWSLS